MIVFSETKGVFAYANGHCSGYSRQTVIGLCKNWVPSIFEFITYHRAFNPHPFFLTYSPVNYVLQCEKYFIRKQSPKSNAWGILDVLKSYARYLWRSRMLFFLVKVEIHSSASSSLVISSMPKLYWCSNLVLKITLVSDCLCTAWVLFLICRKIRSKAFFCIFTQEVRRHCPSGKNLIFRRSRSALIFYVASFAQH